MTDQILEGLLNFVETEDQFAVMIDGGWGSGKTYFLRNRFIPRLKDSHKVTYFSVYGYESLSELKTDLLGKLFIESLGDGSKGENTQSKIDDAATLAKRIPSVSS